MIDLTTHIDIYKLAPDGTCFSKSGALTIGYEIIYPTIRSMDTYDFAADENSPAGYNLITSFALAIKQLENGYTFHQQDIYFPTVLNLQNSDDYLKNSSEKMWQNNEMPMFSCRTFIFINKKFPSLNESTKEDTIIKFHNVCSGFIGVLKDKPFLNIKQLEKEKYIQYITSCLQFNFAEDAPFVEYDFTKNTISENTIHCIAIQGDKNIYKVEPYAKDTKVTDEKVQMATSWLHPVTWGINCTKIINNYIRIDDSVKKKVKEYEKKMSMLSRLFQDCVDAAMIFEEWAKEHTPVFHYYNAIYLLPKDKEKVIRESINSGYKIAGLNPTIITASFNDTLLSLCGGTEHKLSYPTNLYPSFLAEALCFQNYESDSSQNKDGILVSDSQGKPIYLDLDKRPHDEKIITNWNQLIVGASGTGKSVVTNKFISSLIPTNDYFFFIIDIGGSYKPLSLLHKEKCTYIELDKDCKNVSFNPFLLPLVDPKNKEMQEDLAMLNKLICMAWNPDGDLPINRETISVLRDILSAFYEKRYSEKQVYVNFNGLYEYVQKLAKSDNEIIKKDFFNVDSFLLVLKDYYKNGKYEMLFNGEENNFDIHDKNFIVFEMGNIQNDKTLCNILIAILLIIARKVLEYDLPHSQRKIWLDEAWSFLKDGVMGEFILELYKTMRKKGGGVGIIVQEINDILSSEYAAAIFNNSATKIFLTHCGNPNVIEENKYELGLSDKDVKIICSLPISAYPFIVKQGQQPARPFLNSVSKREIIAFSTTKKEREDLLNAVKLNKGNVRMAIEQIANKQ